MNKKDERIKNLGKLIVSILKDLLLLLLGFGATVSFIVGIFMQLPIYSLVLLLFLSLSLLKLPSAIDKLSTLCIEITRLKSSGDSSRSIPNRSSERKVIDIASEAYEILPTEERAPDGDSSDGSPSGPERGEVPL